jgi:WD40 repeat protein
MHGIRLAMWAMMGVFWCPAVQAQQGDQIKRLKGHTDAVLSAVISADGARIVSGSNDGTAIVWDAASGKLLQRLEGHAGGVTAVGISADGGRVLTGSLDRTARVWDAQSGELLAILKGGHFQHVHGAAISPDGKRVVTASCDHSVVLWDVASETPLQRYPNRGEVHEVAFSPDGRTFLSGCLPPGKVDHNKGKYLRLYEAQTGKLLEEFDIETVESISYFDGGRWALVLGLWKLWVLDVEARKLEPLKMSGPQVFRKISPSPDGKKLLHGGPFDTQLLEVETGKLLMRFPNGPNGDSSEAIRVVAIAPDGKWGLIAGGGRNTPWGGAAGEYEPARDADVKIVPLTGDFDPARRTPNELAKIVTGLAVMADSRRLVTSYGDGSLVWWDTASGKETGRATRVLEKSTAAVVISPDGSCAATLSDWKTVRGFDSSGKLIGTAQEQKNFRNISLALAPDGKSAFVGGWIRTISREKVPARAVAVESEVHLLDLPSGKELRTFKAPAGVIHNLAVSPDGRTLIGLCANTYGGEAAALAWEAESAKPLWKWTPAVPAPPKAMMDGLVLSADGRRAAFVYQSSVIVVEMQSGKLMTELTGLQPEIPRIAFDPDGKRIWTYGGSDVAQWDLAKGTQIGSVKLKVSLNHACIRFDEGRRVLVEAVGNRLVEHELDH